MFGFYNITLMQEELSENPTKAFKEIRRSEITSGIQGTTNFEIVLMPFQYSLV